MAVIARCLLHVVYEFQAFLNLFAKQALGLSSGMAAQVRLCKHKAANPVGHMAVKIHLHKSRSPGRCWACLCLLASVLLLLQVSMSCFIFKWPMPSRVLCQHRINVRSCAAGLAHNDDGTITGCLALATQMYRDLQCTSIWTALRQVAAGFSAGSAVAVLAGGFLFCRMQAGGRRNLTFLLCAMTAGAQHKLGQCRINNHPLYLILFKLGCHPNDSSCCVYGGAHTQRPRQHAHLIHVMGGELAPLSGHGRGEWLLAVLACNGHVRCLLWTLLGAGIPLILYC